MPASRPRNTQQRQLIRQVLRRDPGFVSAQQLHEILRSSGAGIGLATVYRTLQSLAEAREVDVLRTPEGELSYRQCSAGHHHHLICRLCGRAVEVRDAPVEAWAEEVAKAHGFRDVNHVVEVYGICPDC